MNFEGESVEQVGFFRLRGGFSARTPHSAQDDNIQVFAQSLHPDQTS
jgi:hypothetical protein